MQKLCDKFRSILFDYKYEYKLLSAHKKIVPFWEKILGFFFLILITLLFFDVIFAKDIFGRNLRVITYLTILPFIIYQQIKREFKELNAYKLNREFIFLSDTTKFKQQRFIIRTMITLVIIKLIGKVCLACLSGCLLAIFWVYTEFWGFSRFYEFDLIK